MKNVIFCVIDAFCYNNIRMKSGKNFVTPFLNELAENNISFNNIYTVAPYTEASLVTILGEELCLENGGYLFGNGTTKHCLFRDFQKRGYKTIYEYSPYIYSKGYLKNVEKFFYSRLYSLSPLYNYRLSYYKNILLSRKLNTIELTVCAKLIEEGMCTWLKQCQKALEGDDSCRTIMHILPKHDVLENIRRLLNEEIKIFYAAQYEYIMSILDEWTDHRLWKINLKYLQHHELSLNQYVFDKYNERLGEYQSQILKVSRKQHVDLRYIVSTLLNNINGKSDAVGILKNYIKHYTRQQIRNYLSDLQLEEKPEVGMYRTFEYSYDLISQYDKENISYFLYLQPQDFHLPSIFHSYDINKEFVVDEEFEECFRFIDKLDNNFKGNIVSALSAHFCDFRIRKFYEKCMQELKNDFIFVVTADHGYPNYYNPPRPYIYNQTYTEAFHVPFIISGSDTMLCEYTDLILSNNDVIRMLKHAALDEELVIRSKGYVLSEYAGPGCPVIVDKPIWYTYIDKNVRLSAQAMLGTSVTYDCITDIFDIRNDTSEKYNLRRKKSQYFDTILKIINKRHAYLSKKYNKKNFYDRMIEGLVE